MISLFLLRPPFLPVEWLLMGPLSPDPCGWDQIKDTTSEGLLVKKAEQAEPNTPATIRFAAP